MTDKLTYSVVENKLTIDSIHTNSINGDITFNGNSNISGYISVHQDSEFKNNLTVSNNLHVKGEIRVPVLYADTLITKTKIDQKDPVVFSLDEGGIEGKGLIWKKDDDNINMFVYKKKPERIFTNIDIDLYKSNSYYIDGTPVITMDSLGPTIIKSSLRKVGRLSNLTVDGDVILGEHIYYNSLSNRLGIGTDKASAAFSLIDDGIEFVMGSLEENVGNFGTYTSHDFSIVTDNVSRMRVSRTGKITFGDEQAFNADVSIFGKLYVKELFVDQRQERSSPLEFRALKGATNYGKGMIFTGHGIHKQFVFAANPDQFFSTENLNLQADKGYFIDNTLLLTKDSLGRTITKSSLTELGTLKNLTVSGNVNLNNIIVINDNNFTIGNTKIDSLDGLRLTGSFFEFKSENQSIRITGENIVFGHKDKPIINAIINGNLAVGMQTVGNNAQLEVAGNIRFANKLFLVGSRAPTTGIYSKGDIIWNTEPKETGYVGWICVRDGNPGIWRGFGQIGIE